MEEVLCASSAYDQKYYLNANKFKRKNFRFIGWSTKKDGIVAYTDKASVIKATPTNGKTIKLYAVWEKKVKTTK